MPFENLADALCNHSRPIFLFGSTPPKEGTSIEQAKASCKKFAERSAVLAIDGFIVYDIQDEGSRTTKERPFPFRKTLDSSLYASFFPEISNKQCVVYKSVIESSVEDYNLWCDKAVGEYGHNAFTLVGAPSSDVKYSGPSLQEAIQLTTARGDCRVGCVTIAERHTSKGNEHLNMIRKSEYGAEWFITQGIFDAKPLIRLLHDYSSICKQKGVHPKKVILTFAPCARQKTMTFVKWLGMYVPEDVETRIFSHPTPVKESINILCEILTNILEQTAETGVPLGINVESLSIFREEIDAAHELFQKLQAILLNGNGSPWVVRWFSVEKLLQLNKLNKELMLNSSSNSSLNSMLDLNSLEKNHSKQVVEKASNVSLISWKGITSLGVAFILGLLVGKKISFSKYH